MFEVAVLIVSHCFAIRAASAAANSGSAFSENTRRAPLTSSVSFSSFLPLAGPLARSADRIERYSFLAVL